ncbi:hypothetical protein Pan241w_09730 [Gimesia alba]|uniref:Uncharacterized protein n=1 Tax=Gimesia alba TaxID=2527973 RepID=A0A517RAJ6_9PLAN|nr:hypothetical protein [Gimesia alba]QDT40914.1 hypothetical protein Pan241w_09730 [Gimesia alba]
MPDPKQLKVNDRVRFVSLPEEWDNPKFTVHASCVRFMKQLIQRKYSSQIHELDENGFPLIEARIRTGKVIVYHGWCIFEETGWVKVQPRKKK